MMTDPTDVTMLYRQLCEHGFEPSDDARRLFAAMTRTPSPDKVLAEAREALKVAFIAADEAAIAEAQAAVNGASAAVGAWGAYEAAEREYARTLMITIREPAFAHVRALYDAAGAAFGNAVSSGVVDQDAGEVMAHGTADQRVAWASLPSLLADLEALADLLGEVVRMGAMTPESKRYNRVPDEKHAPGPLGLLVTPNDAHTRRLVECWSWSGYHPSGINPLPMSEIDRACSGRGGRWAALVRYGATLKVPFERLGDYRPFRVLPYVRTRGGLVDPYDGPESMAAHRKAEADNAILEAERSASRQRVGGVA